MTRAALALLCLFVFGSRMVEAGPSDPAGSSAQGPRDGRLLVTVADPSGGVVPGATVTLVGLEAATKAAAAPSKTNDKGLLTIEALRPGRYSIQAEFSGFEIGLLRDVRVRAGDNKHIVVLPLKRMQDTVTVGQDAQVRAAERRTIGSALTREQIELLSDDPEEMDRQLKELGGSNAVFRVDSFEGAQLPPKAQIKSIHITRDTYAAESHYVGGHFIDIITQPGIGPIRANGNFNFRDGSMSGRSEFTPKKGPEQFKRYGMGLGGSLAKEKASFSLNFNGSNTYDSPNQCLSLPSGTRCEALNIKVPRENLGFFGHMDWAVTRDQTMRFSISRNTSSARNLGIGAFDMPERGYATETSGGTFMVQEAGPLGRRFFINTRAYGRWSTSTSRSLIEAPAVVVSDSFTTGGAQRTGGTRTRALTLQSDLDYVRGIHSWRAGVQLDGTWFRSDDASNYLGTYTFTSIEAFEAGLPAFYTRRIGDPNIRYWNLQGGIYFQDDIRISKAFTISPGVRYELQTHVKDYNGLAPRIGFTWSPWKSGKTTIRAGGGIFYDWLSTGTYSQTIRVDGFRQQELNIVNPTFPDPGSIGTVRATNRYLLGDDYQLARNVGYSIGIDQTITPRIRGSVSYNSYRASHQARGTNLNAPVSGVRLNPMFANVIETVSDGSSRTHSLSANGSFNLLTPSPANNQKRFNWRRLSVFGNYELNRSRNNFDGAFTVPASGTLDTEWGPSPGNRDHWMNLSINIGALRNLSTNLGLSAYSGSAYSITTGLDGNGDQMLNDRPAGVGRNSARVPNWTRTWNARFGYTFGFGRAASSMPPGIMITSERGVMTVGAANPNATAPPRYRLGVNVSITNLTNRSNYGGYSGVMTSRLFGVPTSAGVPRKVDIGINFSF